MKGFIQKEIPENIIVDHRKCDELGMSVALGCVLVNLEEQKQILTTYQRAIYIFSRLGGQCDLLEIEKQYENFKKRFWWQEKESY